MEFRDKRRQDKRRERKEKRKGGWDRQETGEQLLAQVMN